MLYLNPLGNFDFALAIPGFQHSNYMKFKTEGEDDYKLAEDDLLPNMFKNDTINPSEAHVESGFAGTDQNAYGAIL